MGNELQTVRQPDAITRPESFEGLMQMAKVLVDSKFLPSAIDTPAKAAAIMVAGREIGLTGMQSFRELYSVKGQIGMSTRLICAFYKQTGGTYDFLERTADKCTVRLTLASGAQHDYTLTRTDADQAGYTKEKDKDGAIQVKYNWKANPVGMLSNNALKGAIRLWCPECLLDVLGPMALPDAETVDAQVVEAPTVTVVVPGDKPTSTITVEAPKNGNGNGHTESQWADGVVITSKDGKVSKHWYLWPEYQTRFWQRIDKQGLSPKEVCDLLNIKVTDEIAQLNLTPQEVMDTINETIATMGKPEAQNAELPF